MLLKFSAKFLNWSALSLLLSTLDLLNNVCTVFYVYYFWHYFQSICPIWPLLYSTLFPSWRFLLLTFCPIRHLLPSFLCPLVAIYHLTFCPFAIFYHSTIFPSTFCSIQQFVRWHFFTVGAFYFAILSLNRLTPCYFHETKLSLTKISPFATRSHYPLYTHWLPSYLS